MTEEQTPPAAEQPTPDAPEAPAAPAAPEAPAAPAVTEAPKPVRSTTPPDGHWWWGTGRRKAAVARVRVRAGSGKFIINNREMTEFFTELRDHNNLMNVLEKTNTVGKVDVHIKVHGGGYTGQAGAVILGLGRALLRYDGSLEPILRDNNFLSRDPRRVERKKYGQPGARKRFQFSKR